MIGFLVFWIREILRAKRDRVSKPAPTPPREEFPGAWRAMEVAVYSLPDAWPTWTKAGLTWSSRLEPGPVSSVTSSERIREEPSVAVDRTSVR